MMELPGFVEAKNSHEITSAKKWRTKRVCSIALIQMFKLSIDGVGNDRDTHQSPRTQRLEDQELTPMSERSGHTTLLLVSTSFLACQQNNININYI